jgi:hypothetical protein
MKSNRIQSASRAKGKYGPGIIDDLVHAPDIFRQPFNSPGLLKLPAQIQLQIKAEEGVRNIPLLRLQKSVFVCIKQESAISWNTEEAQPAQHLQHD